MYEAIYLSPTGEIQEKQKCSTVENALRKAKKIKNVTGIQIKDLYMDEFYFYEYNYVTGKMKKTTREQFSYKQR
jgi:hypothetical protein